jgi:hypothetical protein
LDRTGHFASGDQGEFTPFPMTVNILKADLSQPLQLRLDIPKLVRRVFILWGHSHRFEEAVVDVLDG